MADDKSKATAEGRMAAAREEFAAAEASYSKAKALLDAARAELDALIAEEPAFASSTDNIHAIRGYLDQQQKVLAERGEKMRLIRESGLDLKALAADLKSPLDASLGSRRKSG